MTKPTEAHPLVQRLLDLQSGGTTDQFRGGFGAAWGAIGFLRKHRELWPNVAIPALINVVTFVVLALALVLNADWFFFDRPTPGAWTYYILIVLWWVFRILLYPLLIVVAYFLTMMIAGVVASPFNDKLSEMAEQIMVGEAVPAEEGWAALVTGGLKGIVASAATAIPRVILVVLLGLIPGAGPILSVLVGAYFIALEYTDYALGRRGYGLRARARLIWTHRRLAIGFGVGAYFLLLIPLLNFLSMPIAVVGGTAVALALDRFESGESNPIVEDAA